jgi:hypothetical protein
LNEAGRFWLFFEMDPGFPMYSGGPQGIRFIALSGSKRKIAKRGLALLGRHKLSPIAGVLTTDCTDTHGYQAGAEF